MLPPTRSHHRHVYNFGTQKAQMQPEVQQLVKKPASKQEYFTNAEVEEKIRLALAQRDREKAEEEQGRFIEIRDAAQQAAKRELIATEQNIEKMTQEKQAKILATSG